MRLKSGDAAVPFTAQTIEGETVSLAQFAGRPLLLMFFRYASCPMCNLRLRDFARAYPRLQERGLTALAFIHSSASSIRAHAGSANYPVQLVSDPAFHVYAKYGVETSWPRLLLSLLKPRFYVDLLRALRHQFWGGGAWQMAKMPADFVIGPDGRIVIAHYGRDIGDHLSVSQIEACLDEMAQSTARGAVATGSKSFPPSEARVPPSTRLAGLALVWSLALVSSSWLLKGSAIGQWVDALLYLGAMVWVSGCIMNRPAARCA